uniref:G-protein coupled receptors family 3 profile domain-containing protein n=1 Tax=Odontella aurita TaxID=265563 RepID=A0A7S4IP86_9STRA
MAFKILSLCQSGVDGIFVSVPSLRVEEAVLKCLELDVPVVTINSGFDFSKNATVASGGEKTSLAHHIGMLEYNAGYGGGERLIRAGATKLICVDHAPGVSVTFERCEGIKQSIIDANEKGAGLTYLGKVDVPKDSAATYKVLVEERVGEGGDWDGYGFLLCGVSQLNSFLRVKEDHPKAVAGSFDVSNEMYDAFLSGDILFGIDQQPYLQGYAPVALLTQIAHTKQTLLNHAIETGPSFVTSPPGPEQQACEGNIFEVCPTTPFEDMNNVGMGLQITGMVLFAVQALLSLFLMGWTYWYRQRSVVRMSQPEFLVLIAFGCLVMSLSIPPLAVEGAYRYVQDPYTGELTDEPDPSIAGADAACMAAPWLVGMGFVIVFSALFAKIWRVKMIYDGAVRFRRETVHARDVGLIMAVTFSVEVALLLAWQLVSPLRWERTVTSTDENGYPTESIGSCTADGAVPFIIPLLVFKALCLLYALYLCYITRNVPSDLAEGKWISFSVLSMFQTLVVGVPILVIVDEDNNAFFFVRVVVVFLICAAVTTLIFGPKVYKLHVSVVGRRKNFTAVSRISRRVSSSLRRASCLRHVDNLSNGISQSEFGDALGETMGGGGGGRRPTLERGNSNPFGSFRTDGSNSARASVLRNGSASNRRLVCTECRKKFPPHEMSRVNSVDAGPIGTQEDRFCKKVSFAEGNNDRPQSLGRLSRSSVLEDSDSAAGLGSSTEDQDPLHSSQENMEILKTSGIVSMTMGKLSSNAGEDSWISDDDDDSDEKEEAFADETPPEAETTAVGRNCEEESAPATAAESESAAP